jgi:hypothetical protein
MLDWRKPHRLYRWGFGAVGSTKLILVNWAVKGSWVQQAHHERTEFTAFARRMGITIGDYILEARLKLNY